MVNIEESPAFKCPARDLLVDDKDFEQLRFPRNVKKTGWHQLIGHDHYGPVVYKGL